MQVVTHSPTVEAKHSYPSSECLMPKNVNILSNRGRVHTCMLM